MEIKMKTKIDVESVEEGRQLRIGLSDPSIRAFVRVMGTLGTLKSQRAKERVMTFVKDHFDEMEANQH
jgi:general stress protein 26